MKKLVSFVLVMLIIGHLGFSVPIFAEDIQKSFVSNILEDGEIIISRKIIERFDDGGYVVETISKK